MMENADLCLEQEKECFELIYINKLSATEVGKLLGINRTTAKRRANRFLRKNPNFKISEKESLCEKQLSKENNLKTYIISTLQSNSCINEKLYTKIKVLKDYLDAEIILSKINIKAEEKIFSEEIEKNISKERISLAEDLIFCADINIPKNNINGYDSFLGNKSLILPVNKFCLESVANENLERTKLIFGTMTICEKNYKTSNRQGIFSNEDHELGFLLVQVNSKGSWTCHNVEYCEETETIYWKNICVNKENLIEENIRLEAMVYGDSHFSKMTSESFENIWGKENSLAEITKPLVQVYHDFFDGNTITRHNKGNHNKNFQSHHTKKNSLWNELNKTYEMISKTKKYDSKQVIVQSNHDDYILNYVNNNDYREDPENSLVYLLAQSVNYLNLSKNGSLVGMKIPKDFMNICENLKKYSSRKKFLLIEYIFKEWFELGEDYTFLSVDEKFIIKDTLLNHHGDKGRNGSKGSFNQFVRLPYSTITGHSHDTFKRGKAWRVGLSSNLNMEYNVGLSTWIFSQCGIYPNGKKTMFIASQDGTYFLD